MNNLSEVGPLNHTNSSKITAKEEIQKIQRSDIQASHSEFSPIQPDLKEISGKSKKSLLEIGMSQEACKTFTRAVQTSQISSEFSSVEIVMHYLHHQMSLLEQALKIILPGRFDTVFKIFKQNSYQISYQSYLWIASKVVDIAPHKKFDISPVFDFHKLLKDALITPEIQLLIQQNLPELTITCQVPDLDQIEDQIPEFKIFREGNFKIFDHFPQFNIQHVLQNSVTKIVNDLKERTKIEYILNKILTPLDEIEKIFQFINELNQLSKDNLISIEQISGPHLSHDKARYTLKEALINFQEFLLNVFEGNKDVDVLKTYADIIKAAQELLKAKNKGSKTIQHKVSELSKICLAMNTHMNHCFEWFHATEVEKQAMETQLTQKGFSINSLQGNTLVHLTFSQIVRSHLKAVDKEVKRTTQNQ